MLKKNVEKIGKNGNNNWKNSQFQKLTQLLNCYQTGSIKIQVTRWVLMGNLKNAVVFFNMLYILTYNVFAYFHSSSKMIYPSFNSLNLFSCWNHPVCCSPTCWMLIFFSFCKEQIKTKHKNTGTEVSTYGKP